MRFASSSLCNELYKLTKWYFPDRWFHSDFNDLWTLMPADDDIGKTFKPVCPAYDLGFLVDKALETGHIHVKIKEGDKGIIVTAPPCYHIEAKTPADGVAKLLIRSAKKGVITS